MLLGVWLPWQIAKAAKVSQRTAYAALAALHNTGVLQNTIGREYVIAFKQPRGYVSPLLVAYDAVRKLSTIEALTKKGRARQLFSEVSIQITVLQRLGEPETRGVNAYVKYLRKRLSESGTRLISAKKYLPREEYEPLMDELADVLEMAEVERGQSDNLKSCKNGSFSTKYNNIISNNSLLSREHDGFATSPSKVHISNELAPKKQKKRLPAVDLPPKKAQLVRNLGGKRVFNLMHQAYRAVAGRRGVFKAAWETVHANVRECMCVLGEGFVELGFTDTEEMLSLIKGAFAYHKLIYRRFPPHKSLHCEQMIYCLESMCKAHGQMNWYRTTEPEELAAHEIELERWGLQASTVARLLRMPDPRTHGGKFLKEFNQWILLKSYKDFQDQQMRHAQLYRQGLPPRYYLQANIEYIKNQRGRTYEELMGEFARQRATAHMQIKEPSLYCEIEEMPERLMTEEEKARHREEYVQ